MGGTMIKVPLAGATGEVLSEPKASQNTVTSTDTVVDLVLKRAQTHPKRIAIIDRDDAINYQQLTLRANAIASELKSRGLIAGSLVGVCMNRSWELVATLLGVLEAGCAYVPLDPSYPKERIQYILSHSRAAAAILDHKDQAQLCEGIEELIWLDHISTQEAVVLKSPKPDDLAYVIYTSGSTGKPKGVAVEHRCLTSLSRAMGELLSQEELSGVLAGISVCFDPSVMEILGTLSLGGSIVMAQNALELFELPAVDQLKTCIMVPSAMQALLTTGELPKTIKTLVFGGEILKRSLVDQLYAQNPDLRIVNVYGPTEDTVYSTAGEVSPNAEIITIGKAITNSRSYILDESMRPVPIGVMGELYLAGDKLARGYLNDDELTRKRFIEAGQCEAFPRERLYRTGDLCQWRENGEIEYLGRIDQQVKIRGFRIELEEIESVAETMPGVDAAAATALDGGVGQKILAMYIINRNETVSEGDLKAYLGERLPPYMVPQVVMHLRELPILPNGKLDRKQLPNLEEALHGNQVQSTVDPYPHSSAHLLDHRLVGSKEDQYAVMLSIIRNELASLLSLNDPEAISANDSFDGLGLDSLTKVELRSRLSKTLDRQLPVRTIFEHDTAATLVAFILGQSSKSTDHGPAEATERKASNTLADFQTAVQSSHPTFQAAKAKAWCATDKARLVGTVKDMVNDLRRNPYSKVLRTGSGTRGTVADAYTQEEREAIIWTTNLYLGLNRDETVIAEASHALNRLGSGMGTSAAASGLTDLHLEFERSFANLVGKPAACLFPTGYTANIGAVAGLLGEEDVVIIDQLCHASIVDGARLSGSTIRTFQHNNPADLETVLKSEASPYRTILVAIEGVYSMGEGAAPVAEIVHMAKKYNALVLVDEAHSFGFYGERGAGICAAQGVTEEVDFIMTTLSKSMGSLGGVVAAREEHIDLLKASARAYIFQASVSPADIAAALTALRRIQSDDSLRERLWDTAAYMRQRFSEAGFDLGTGDGPIVTPHFCDKDKLYAIVQGLYRRGVQTSAVTYPIVERGRGRLRFICSASHSRQDVDKTLEALIEAEREADEQLKHINTETGYNLNIEPTEIRNWAHQFSDHLRVGLGDVIGQSPNLSIFIELPNQAKPITIALNEGTVISNPETMPDLPSFSILLSDDQAAQALLSWNAQALLQSICQGTCVLNGQVEPFIWFIGRLIDKRDSIVS